MKPPIRMRITNTETGVVLARRVWVARAFWDRLRGLYGRPRLAEGDALVLLSSRTAHTIGLDYAIVAVYLDAEGRVIAAPLLASGKVGPYRRVAYMVVLLPASRAAMVSPGDLLEIGIDGPTPTPPYGGRRRRPRRYPG